MAMATTMEELSELREYGMHPWGKRWKAEEGDVPTHRSLEIEYRDISPLPSPNI